MSDRSAVDCNAVNSGPWWTDAAAAEPRESGARGGLSRDGLRSWKQHGLPPPMASGTAAGRTVVVSGVPGVLAAGRMADKLTVHFQRARRSHGGDVEAVTFPTDTDGVAFVTFDRAADANRVVRKERQIMKDDEFPEDYTLTVFPFSADVFLYVSSATLDLSVFGGDQTSLIKSLRSTHRSIRFRSFPEQRKAFVEGPLSAVKTLKEDLISRAKRLQPSAQTAAVKPKDTSSDPSGTPYPGVVGSQGFSGAKAMQKPSRSGSLQQNTVEVKDFNPKTEAFSTRNVSNESSARERFRHVTGEESSAGIGSLSRLERSSVQEKSAKRQRSGGFSEKRNQSERHSGLGSSVTNTRVSESRGATAGNSEDLSPEDILVDLYTFKYIEKFHKKELDIRLRDVDTITSEEVGGLVRISLTENKLSKMGLRHLGTTSDKLKSLLVLWNETLRVHKISYNKSLTKERLTAICEGTNCLYRDVLCVFEDSHVKVIGPSASSYQFYNKVEGEVAKLLCEVQKKSRLKVNENKGA